ncbi:glycosyltransferase family 4 protein [Sphingomonas flavalba]|uniref:glycosyltransferase family 4 protein n=1 Tax=Sphingomonas flavalba TaxID=2559804 RepID=UPI0039E0DC32
MARPEHDFMHIAFISQYFYPESFSNNSIARHLVHMGHSVDAVTCVPNYPAGTFSPGYSNRLRRQEVWEGVHIFRALTVPRGKSAIRLMLNYLLYPIAASWTLSRRLRRRPDVSFVSMPSPLFQAFAGITLKWRKAVPCVYWVQDIWPESATYTFGIRSPLIVRPLNWICGWLYRQADIVMVQSAAFPAMIERFGVDASRIRILPNTAPDNFKPIAPEDAPAEAHLVPQEGFRLMFAGNIGESQDFDTLIAAAALLRDRIDLTWVIIGSGRDDERVRRVITAHGLTDRFRFLGRHEEEQMPYFFSHADAMIVSLKDSPIFALTVPYKVQCYMACGKPLIASLNGEGARIISEAGAGLVAPASTPHLLAEAITRMMDMPLAQRNEMAERSRGYFDENYSPSVVYGRLEQTLSEAADTQAS